MNKPVSEPGDINGFSFDQCSDAFFRDNVWITQTAHGIPAKFFGEIRCAEHGGVRIGGVQGADAAKHRESAIKSSLGKLRLARPIERFVSEQLAANGFMLLNIELRHTAKIEKQPFHHRDPFDRLLDCPGDLGKTDDCIVGQRLLQIRCEASLVTPGRSRALIFQSRELS